MNVLMNHFWEQESVNKTGVQKKFIILWQRLILMIWLVLFDNIWSYLGKMEICDDTDLKPTKMEHLCKIENLYTIHFLVPRFSEVATQNCAIGDA